jgi:hypothetical protein
MYGSPGNFYLLSGYNWIEGFKALSLNYAELNIGSADNKLGCFIKGTVWLF